MKNNKLFIIFIILLIVASIYYFSNHKGSLNLKNSSFAIESVNEITKIKILEGEKYLLLEKTFEQWKVNEKYLVNKWGMQNFLKAINRIDVSMPVSKTKKEQLASILKADGIIVEIYKGKRLHKKYYVSKPIINKKQTYMMMHKSSEPFVVGIPSFKGLVADLFITDETFWRDKTIFNYQPQNIKTIKVKHPQNNQESFKLINFNDGTFALKKLEDNTYIKNFNVNNAAQYFTYFQRIAFEDIVDDKQVNVDSVLQSISFIEIEVEDMNEAVTKVKLYRKPPGKEFDEFGEKAKYDYNRAYAVLNDNTELIIIQYYIFDPLFKEIDYFR